MRSDTNPTGGKEYHTLSLRLNTTSTLSGSCPTRVPWDRQPSVTALESRLPQTYEDRVDDNSVPPDDIIAVHCSHSSTSVHTGDTRERGSLESETKVVEVDEQVTGEIGAAGGEKVNTVPGAHPHPIQLTSTQAEVTEELATVSSRTLSPSTIPCSTTATPNVSNSTANLHRGSTLPPSHSISLSH